MALGSALDRYMLVKSDLLDLAHFVKGREDDGLHCSLLWYVRKDNKHILVKKWGNSFWPSFNQAYTVQLKPRICCQCMPVGMVRFILELLWHAQSSTGQAVILEWTMLRSCIIKSHTSTSAFSSSSALCFCNWRCHHEMNSAVRTDFTLCYQILFGRDRHMNMSKNIPLSCIINIFIMKDGRQVAFSVCR